MNKDHDICFIGLKCYDYLVRKPVPRYLGGIEKQMVSLARMLARGGLRVAFITYDHGTDDLKSEDNITIIKAFGPNEGIPLVRFVYPRMTGLWKAMRKANAKKYMQMGAGSETGVVALGMLSKKLKGSRFSFFLASNADSNPELPSLRKQREKILYKYGIKKADSIVAQNKLQASQVEEHFGRKAKIMPLFFNPENKREAPCNDGQVAINLLWVGRIVPLKRAEMLISLAETFPSYRFHIVGNANTTDEYSEGIMQKAGELSNIQVHGKVSEEKLHRLYMNATGLVCTSRLEGFPNTFVEAWSYILPVLTTYDPDDIVATHGIGKVAKDLEEFKNILANIQQQDYIHNMKKSIKGFYSEYIDPASTVKRYTQYFTDMDA